MNHFPIWKRLNKPQFGLASNWSAGISELKLKNPAAMPNVRHGNTLIITSDFSGQHKKSRFDVFTFLLADLKFCHLWQSKRLEIRKNYLSDGRRMSFKNLNDKYRQFALRSFLEAANHIPGIVVSVAIDKSIRTIFIETPKKKLDMNDSHFLPYKGWNSQSFEHMLRAINFICIFLSGLSKPGQNVLWFSDEDEIVANVPRLTQVTNLFANISSTI